MGGEGRILRDSGWGGVLWCSGFWMWRDQCPHEITATMTAYVRPAPDQASEHTAWMGGRLTGLHHLLRESWQLVAAGEGRVSLSLGVWSLQLLYTPVDSSTHVCVLALPCYLKGRVVKLGVGRKMHAWGSRRSCKGLGNYMIRIHCIHVGNYQALLGFTVWP